MTHSIVIPVMDQLHDTKGIIALLKNITSSDPEYVFIDNSGHDNYEEFIYKYLKPKKVRYIKNEENKGVLSSLQQGYEASSGDIITFLHNDVFIYEQDWDRKIVEIMEEDKEIGLISAFGSSGVGPMGERIQAVRPGLAPGFSSMLEANIHGEKIPYGDKKYIACIDGFFMSIRKDLLKKTGGFDVNTYSWHHFYDRDIALESIRHGYKNLAYGLNCHHWCGKTASQPDYQEQVKKEYGSGKYQHTNEHSGDKAIHDDNMERFKNKWGEVLPIYVDPITGLLLQNEYKGDIIIGYES